MKPPCIGLVLFIVVIGCRQQAQVAETPSNKTTPGENPGNPDLSTATSDEGESGWVSDSWNSALKTGSQSAADTSEWLNTLYKSAVDQGLTTATSMKEWVASDLKSQGDWEYRLLTVQSNAISETEAKLNELGSGRWECFHITEQNGNWVFFMKRSQRSVLSRVPLRDLVNIFPLLGGSGDDGQ